MKNKNDIHLWFIENLPEAFAYHQVVTDDTGNPVDFIFLQINAAFEEMTGLQRRDVIGRKVTEVLPDVLFDDLTGSGFSVK